MSRIPLAGKVANDFLAGEKTMSDLNALLLFARVVQANSFSAAARRLKIPVSTVSRRIAELENQLGVRLLERSTRSLRLTTVGADVFEHAQRGAELSDAVDNVVSDTLSQISGTLRLSAPPSLADGLLAPLAGAFQTLYPDVRIQVFVTDRIVDHISEDVDLSFRVGPLRDSSLMARRILTYRHQLVASPTYLAACKAPETPQDLLDHRLLAFSFWQTGHSWRLTSLDSKDKQTLGFEPFLAMNDYAGLAVALLAGAGIGDLPPVVQPHLLREGRLVEVMPNWRFRRLDMSIVHFGNRHVPRLVRIFKDFAAEMVPRLFPDLPA